LTPVLQIHLTKKLKRMMHIVVQVVKMLPISKSMKMLKKMIMVRRKSQH
jgi:hypothetical protein